MVNMDKPSISVIVPVFNAETHLENLLESLFTQSESSIEIIAVNDGSTDSSAKILERLAKKDSRLRVLNKANGGVSSARNFGLKHAIGKWIAFADSDDWMEPATLETWLNQAEQQNLDFLVGNGFRFFDHPNTETDSLDVLPGQHSDAKIVSGEEWVIQSIAKNEWPHYVWLQLINAELIRQNNLRFKEGMVHEDVLWTLNLALGAQRVGFNGKQFYGYRRNPLSIMSNRSQQSLIERAHSYIILIQDFVLVATNSQPVLRKALLRHVNRESGHFLGLMRKKINAPKAKQRLAKEFLNHNLIYSVFRGAVKFNEYWRAVRCYLIISRIALLSK